MPSKFLWLVFSGVFPFLAPAAIVGTNPASFPLSAERIAALPSAEQQAWRLYLLRSARQRAIDQKLLADEIKALGGTAPTVAKPPGRGGGRLPSNQPAAWYASVEARRMADNVITFQTPAGGWSKNFNAADHARRPGEAFSPDTNTSRFLTAGDNDQPADAHWSYIGTFDNDATIRELRFIAKVVAAADGKSGAGWRNAFARGLEYILAAQYPNGGWPQNYPLDGGYHDAVTFNDGAFANIVTLLRAVATGQDDFGFVPAELRSRADASAKRGITCLLRAQIVIDGRRTVWCQQHDMLTLTPTSARNYEMPSQSGAESAGLAVFLMELPDPTPEIAEAVHAAVAWLKKTALRDVAFRASADGTGRKLVPSPGASPLWARYYEIRTDRPIFGDRDKTIHDDVNEISAERRNGYSWFNDTPRHALERYAKWVKTHSAK